MFKYYNCELECLLLKILVISIDHESIYVKFIIDVIDINI